MSFSDTPTTWPSKGFALFLYMLISFPFVLYSLVNAWIGRCDSDGCIPWVNFLVFQFPGPITLILFGGFLVFRWATR